MENEVEITLPLDLVNDKNITTKAKFLYCFMLTKSKRSNFSVRVLSKLIGESTVTVNKMLKELKELGWIEYRRGSYNKTHYKMNITPKK